MALETKSSPEERKNGKLSNGIFISCSAPYIGCGPDRLESDAGKADSRPCCEFLKRSETQEATVFFDLKIVNEHIPFGDLIVGKRWLFALILLGVLYCCVLAILLKAKIKLLQKKHHRRTPPKPRRACKISKSALS